MKRFLGIAVLSVVVACAAKTPTPQHLIDPVSSPHVDYPKDRFFCALGVSSGDSASLANADEKARQGVAAQVSSTIQSEVSRRTTQNIRQQNGSTQVSSQTQAESVVLQRSDYQDNQLIRIVDSSTPKGEYRALACLDRREAAQVLLNRIAGELTRHAEAASTARTATESGNLASFSAAFSEAKSEAVVLGPALANARVLLGGLTEQHQRFQADSKELTESASKLRSRVVLHVAPIERASEDGAKAVRQSLARLGFSAESGRRPNCPEQELGFSLAVQFDLGCEDRPNTVGQYPCRPRLDLRVRDCSEQSLVLVAEVSGKAIWGAGNSLDRAQRQALERLNSNRLDGLLGETLSSALPTP